MICYGFLLRVGTKLGIPFPSECALSECLKLQAIVGTADLVTPRSGAIHRTSAASLVLFDEEKNVIWKAP